MKRIMTICLSLCLMMLAGCADNKTYPPITLDPGNGEVRSISIDDAIEKKNDGENFLLIVTQTYCGYCMDFFAESDAYTKAAGITLWCVTLDKEEYSEEQNLKLVHDNFGDFSSTPSLYYIGEGETQDMLLSSEEQVTLESYQTWLKENHIIEEDE
ncbi:MAG TPA: hypothetical protein H9702_09075 [Candidatus Merdibacter merdavium]|uniref:Thioredoxin domain-containing protein n=1 Tax=Candidatus Merdibacter merdavium TaxID=2838692 RepID=A0A9D2SX09_9FIRM|nr:hypothetical protein [Candidatus Merdibacter merdavium]